MKPRRTMLTARDIMSPVVLTLAADDTAASAAETLAKAGVSGARSATRRRAGRHVVAG